MSVKRQATTELNHENWDQEEPAEDNEIGTFKTASRDILEKRVIRTAKRRAPISSDEPKKSIFQNTKFGDFNKPVPTSFDFLANLTNQNKSNGSSDTSVSSSLFGNKQAASSGGLFSNSANTTPKSSAPATSPFGSKSTLFTASKADSTVNESPFKMQPVSSTEDSKTNKLTSSPQLPSNVFAVSSSANDKSPFANSSPFKMQTVSSTTTTMVQTSFGISTNPAVPAITPEKKDEDKPNENKMKYYAKLKGLNESVSDWISKHVAQTPLCILSPIFKDYEKYLKEIMDEYQGSEKGEAKKTENSTPEKTEKVPETKSSLFGGTNTGSSLFSSTSSAPKQPAFGAQNNANESDNKTANFSFGIKSPSNAITTTTSTGFSFGVTSTASSTANSPFSLTTTSTQNSAPFSFGAAKPFSFSPNNIQANSKPQEDKTNTEDNDDEPPKVEYTPVKEDNSVYEKTCKVFVKKDGNFADKGVGTLYVKKIEESGKHQLLVRANTNLGTVLLNLILSSAVPMQRAGKNNVMLVCIPTPDAKPPPTPVLIRVKTTENADELLETLKKHTV